MVQRGIDAVKRRTFVPRFPRARPARRARFQVLPCAMRARTSPTTPSRGPAETYPKGPDLQTSGAESPQIDDFSAVPRSEGLWQPLRRVLTVPPSRLKAILETRMGDRARTGKD